MKEQPKEDLSREGFLMVLPLKYLDLKAHYKAWLESMLRYVKKDIQSQINDRLNSFDKDFPDPPIDKKLIGTFIYDHENQKEIYTSVEQPKEDKDWKEKFMQNGVEVTPEYIIEQITIDANNGVQWNQEIYLRLINGLIQPLQSKNEALQKQVEHLKALGHEFVDNNEALQKEVDDYKALLSSATTKGQELIEENAELKAEKQ